MISLGLKSKWIEFRRRRIREEFQRLVGETGISLPVPEHTVSPVSALAEPDVRTRLDSIPSVRQIVSEVVQRMTEPELRALNLPLGYVIDSLRAR